MTRIRNEISVAQNYFNFVESHSTQDGKIFVLSAIQTAVRLYIVEIWFPDTYPYEMPTVHIRKPALPTDFWKHRYNTGNICYLHPQMWNPGLHSLTMVIQRAAKWLAKYEVFTTTGSWPGAERPH